MRWVVGIVVLGAVGATIWLFNRPPGEETARDVRAAAVIERTQDLVDRAARVVRPEGEEADPFRGAWMRQEAARRAAAEGKEPLAAKLSLQARKLALKVLAGRGQTIEEAWAQVGAGEKRLADGADVAEHDAWMEEAERTTLPAAELLREQGLGGGSAADLGSAVERLLDRTDAVAAQAEQAAAEGGQATEKLAGIRARQLAARRALADQKPRFAAKFSLIARRHALQVLEANGEAVDPELRETAAEKAIKAPVEDAPDSVVDPMLAAAEEKR